MSYISYSIGALLLTNVDVSRGIFIKIWWAFFWRFSAAAVAMWIVVATVFSFLEIMTQSQRVEIYHDIFLDLSLIPSSMWALWVTLTNRFRGFTIEITTPDQYF